MTTPPTNPSLRFLNVSVGVIAVCAVIGLMICVGCIGVFVYVFDPSEPAAAAPTVKITKCRYADEDATVWFKTTNNADTRKSYWLRFAVKDAGGNLLGEAKGYVSTLDPGETADDDVTIFYDGGSVGASCEYVGVVADRK